jgi:hypothetical protein
MCFRRTCDFVYIEDDHARDTLPYVLRAAT